MAAQILPFIQFLPGPEWNSMSRRTCYIFRGAEKEGEREKREERGEKREKREKEREGQWSNNDTIAITPIGKEK